MDPVAAAQAVATAQVPPPAAVAFPLAVAAFPPVQVATRAAAPLVAVVAVVAADTTKDC